MVCNLHYEGFLIVELCDSLPPNETRAIYGIFVIFKILSYSCKSRCDVDMDKHGNEGQSSGTCSRKLKPSITINKNVIVRRLKKKKALNFSATICSLSLKKSDVFNFQTSYLTVHLIQKFYVNYKINKLLLKYL